MQPAGQVIEVTTGVLLEKMARNGRRSRNCGAPGNRATRKRSMRIVEKWWFCVIEGIARS